MYTYFGTAYLESALTFKSFLTTVLEAHNTFIRPLHIILFFLTFKYIASFFSLVANLQTFWFITGSLYSAVQSVELSGEAVKWYLGISPISPDFTSLCQKQSPQPNQWKIWLCLSNQQSITGQIYAAKCGRHQNTSIKQNNIPCIWDTWKINKSSIEKCRKRPPSVQTSNLDNGNATRKQMEKNDSAAGLLANSS